MSRIYNSERSIQPLPVMVAFTVLHVALGAVTLASSIVFAIQVIRNVRRPMRHRDERCFGIFMKPYIELTKPRITWLILMSTGIGYFFGWRGEWNWLVFLHTILGTGLIASGTAALNQWYEREADSKMRRTKGRPLPSARLSPNRALVWGLLLSLAGFLELCAWRQPPERVAWDCSP